MDDASDNILSPSDEFGLDETSPFFPCCSPEELEVPPPFVNDGDDDDDAVAAIDLVFIRFFNIDNITTRSYDKK